MSLGRAEEGSDNAKKRICASASSPGSQLQASYSSLLTRPQTQQLKFYRAELKGEEEGWQILGVGWREWGL